MIEPKMNAHLYRCISNHFSFFCHFVFFAPFEFCVGINLRSNQIIKRSVRLLWSADSKFDEKFKFFIHFMFGFVCMNNITKQSYVLRLWICAKCFFYSIFISDNFSLRFQSFTVLWWSGADY